MTTRERWITESAVKIIKRAAGRTSGRALEAHRALYEVQLRLQGRVPNPENGSAVLRIQGV